MGQGFPDLTQLVVRHSKQNRTSSILRYPEHVERLSGLDASFLYLETGSQLMNVCALLELDPSTAGDDFGFEWFRAELGKRVETLAPFRRKVHDLPLNLGHPVWVDDPDFDIDRHLHRFAVPAPGGPEELAYVCAHIAGQPINRDRPLWEMWFLEGLADGTVAVLIKVHHAAVDGVTGANLITALCAVEPGQLPPADGDQPPPTRPHDLSIVVDGLLDFARRPLDVVRLVPRTLGMVPDWVRRALRGKAMPAPFTAPRVSFNGTITGRRGVAFTQLDLAEVKRVKRCVGGTVNDVLLTVCAGALRRYLSARGELPEQPLLATVPVSVHGRSDLPGTNKVSALFCSVRTDLADPAERLRVMAQSNRTAKEHHHAIDANMLQDWAMFAAPATFGLAVRAYSALRLAERHPVVHNLVISNVPGPPMPMYLLGARVVGMYPFGPVFHGAALNITMLSHAGHVDIGLIGCRELVPDPWSLAEAFAPALAELSAVAAERRPPGARDGGEPTTKTG
jgi:diacylglycerol O-acyltransferase / wax synthase